MYVKVTPRKKTNKTYYYAELVEGYRENGKVKHNQIAYIGAVDIDTANRLKMAFSKKTKMVDLDSLEFNSSVDYGDFQYLYQLLNDLGMYKYFTKHFKPVDSHITIDTSLKYIQLMILNRIIEPGSKLALLEWLDFTPYKHFFDMSIDLQSMYRSLEVLENNLKHIEKFFFTTATNKFNQNRNELFYDITSSYMEGNKCIIADYGYSRDHRSDRKQIVIGLVTTYDGFPIKCNVYEGNTSDKTTVVSIVKELKAQFDIEQFIFVGDRGMLTEANVLEIREQKQGFVMAIPREWTKKYLKNTTIDEQNMKEIKKGELYSKFIEYENENDSSDRFLLCLNVKKRADDRIYRAQIIAKIISDLNELNTKASNKKSKINTKDDLIGKAAIIKRKKFGKYFDLNYAKDKTGEYKCGYKVQYTIDKKKINGDKKLDGTFLIQTNALKYSDKELVYIYKNLSEVETAFKIIKNELDIRPMFHRKESRVKGHVYICVLAYFLYNVIDYRLRENNLDLSPEKLLNKLKKISLVEIEITSKDNAYKITKVNEEDQKIFAALNIKVKQPPKI